MSNITFTMLWIRTSNHDKHIMVTKCMIVTEEAFSTSHRITWTIRVIILGSFYCDKTDLKIYM
jgi:hypothetical protein